MAYPFTKETPAVLTQRVNARAIELKEAATAEERAIVEALVAKAKKITDPTDQIMEKVQATPAIMAILWLDHNTFNRAWNPRTSAEYAEMMTAGKWRQTSQSVYALYGGSGSLADCQHRAAAQIMSGCTFDVFFCLGMSRDDVAALDAGKKRKASDVGRLLYGIANAPAKQTLLTGLWQYLGKVGIESDVVSDMNVQAVADKIREHNKLLTRALEIGDAASMEANDPLVRDLIAAKIACIMLYGGWESDRISDYLAEVQTEEFTSDTSPLFHAREKIDEHRKPEAVWGDPERVNIIVKAILMALDGIELRPSSRARMRELIAAAKHPVDPRTPEQAEATPIATYITAGDGEEVEEEVEAE